MILELPEPLAIRRPVAFASAVRAGEITIDGVPGRRVESGSEALSIARDGFVAVMASPGIADFGEPISVLVDARLAKRNIDTQIDQAPLVVALGPGFTAGVDCDAVVETMRGHRLGRVIWHGAAAPNTGIPGSVGGASAERVLRAPVAGPVEWSVDIGDAVSEAQQLGTVGGQPVRTTIGGVVRGLITPGFQAPAGLKIADVDPRADRSACFEISDKARLVGSGVLEAALTWLNRQ